MTVPQLHPDTVLFPPADAAETDPNGLLAWGGDLRVERLRAAYRAGIFPWYESGQPILWWCPDPRAVLFPDRFHISRRLARILRQGQFRVTLDYDFAGVVTACAAPAPGREGTWITPEMEAAYCRLHQHGLAHSVECWRDGRLCGGIYGVAMGRVFFGESMFSGVSNASKVAMACLVRLLRGAGFRLLDCQVPNGHLASLGAEEIPRPEFLQLLDQWVDVEPEPGTWLARELAPGAPQAPGIV